MAYRSVFVTFAAGIVALAVPAVTNAALFTYRLSDGGERLFRYSGGLAGGGFDARLEGTFAVERDENGSSSIVRFDISIADPLLRDLTPPRGNPAGKPLLDYLVHNPVGLMLAAADPPASAPDDSTHPRTNISLSDMNWPMPLLRLYSGFGRLLDAPASFTREGGVAVELVPEPASLILATVAASALARCRRYSPSPAVVLPPNPSPHGDHLRFGVWQKKCD